MSESCSGSHKQSEMALRTSVNFDRTGKLPLAPGIDTLK